MDYVTLVGSLCIPLLLASAYFFLRLMGYRYDKIGKATAKRTRITYEQRQRKHGTPVDINITVYTYTVDGVDYTKKYETERKLGTSPETMEIRYQLKNPKKSYFLGSRPDELTYALITLVLGSMFLVVSLLCILL